MKLKKKDVVSIILLIGLCIFSRFDDEILTFYTNDQRNTEANEVREVVYIQGVSSNVMDTKGSEETVNPNLMQEPNIAVLLTNENDTYEIDSFNIDYSDTCYIDNQEQMIAMNEPINDDTLKNYQNGENALLIGQRSLEDWDYDARMLLTINGNSQIYQGILRIEQCDGCYYVVNILPLETYLCYVLPSEMPSDFPPDALRAQAVCARTYAYQFLESNQLEEYHADVDDTTAYQVYHASTLSPSANEAVTSTRGQIMTYDGEPINAYYYSCSCGHSTTPDIWRNNQGKTFPYLQYQEFDPIEADIPWYSWSYKVHQLNQQELLDNIGERLRKQPEIIRITSHDNRHIYNSSDAINILNSLNTEDITDLEITERKSGEVAECLMITIGDMDIWVEGEYSIRCVLGASNAELTRQDGSVMNQTMVPSGFFTLNVYSEDGVISGYNLKGGGFGHGVGMSQYGARALALLDYDYESILTYYYQNVTIEKIYE
ncbi:MAG TPA: SpoIID/LytB domain-containing protein [Lachnospiraceae bacterium]|nr:SpoIID/LytB domain-containing protein [Lachnospiraceae bacterium]